MTWNHVKAIIYGILALLLIILVGQFGWVIILGTISVLIIAAVYLIIRIIVEWSNLD